MESKELMLVSPFGEVNVQIAALEVSTIVSLPGPVILALAYKGKHLSQGGLDSIDTGKNRGPVFGSVRRVFTVHDNLKRIANLMVQLRDPAEIVLHLVMAVLGGAQYEEGKESCKAAENYSIGKHGTLNAGSCDSEMNYVLQNESGQAKKDRDSHNSRPGANNRK